MFLPQPETRGDGTSSHRRDSNVTTVACAQLTSASTLKRSAGHSVRHVLVLLTDTDTDPDTHKFTPHSHRQSHTDTHQIVYILTLTHSHTHHSHTLTHRHLVHTHGPHTHSHTYTHHTHTHTLTHTHTRGSQLCRSPCLTVVLCSHTHPCALLVCVQRRLACRDLHSSMLSIAPPPPPPQQQHVRYCSVGDSRHKRSGVGRRVSREQRRTTQFNIIHDSNYGAISSRCRGGDTSGQERSGWTDGRRRRGSGGGMDRGEEEGEEGTDREPGRMKRRKRQEFWGRGRI